MEFFSVFIVLLMTVFLLVKKGVSPVSVFLAYNAMSTVVFILNDLGLVYFESYVGMPIEMLGNYSYSSWVYTQSVLLTTVFFSYSYYYLRRGAVSKTKEGLGRGIGEVRRYEVAVFGFSLMFFCFFLVHLLEVNMELMLFNTSYLLNVTPINVGISSFIGTTAHHLTGPGGVLMAVVFILSLKIRSPHIAFVSFLVVVYCLFIKTSQMSRWAPLIICCVSASVYFLYSGRLRSFIVFLGGVSTFVFVLGVLRGRGNYEQGFYGFLKACGELGEYGVGSIKVLLLNIFGGLIVLAESLEVDHVYYLEYAIRSFSFLPSSLDGWAEYVSDTGRINLYSPFNVFSELYFFPSYISFLGCVTIIFIFCRMDFLHKNLGGFLRYIPLIVFFYVVFSSYYYPIRNVFRVLLVVYFLYEVFWHLHLKKEKRRLIK